nr:hypothetical protein [Gemmatimonadaceae bacterium]
SDRSKSLLSGDRGLFQINSVWDQQLIAAGIIRTKSDLFDPAINAKAARYVYQKQGLYAWGMGSGSAGWTAGGDPFKGTNIEAAKAAVQNAAKNGFIGGDYGMSDTGTTTSGPVSLPSDARLVQNQNGTFAMFQLGTGLWVHYAVGPDVTGGGRVTKMSNAEFGRAFGKSVDGGSAAELTAVRTSYGSYAKFWDSIVTQVLGQANPATQDPGVRRVIAEFAARPDMSEAELQNKLKATSYWQTRTEGELEWNSLSAAERTSRSADTASRMQQTWFQFAGQQVGANAPEIKASLEAVASGKMSMSQWTEQVVKPKSLALGESPWSRQIRSEGVSQRQRGVDIENTAKNLRDTLHQYGLSWSEDAITRNALAVVDKKKSDKDFLDQVQTAAQAMYPWKDKTLDTATAAEPWIATYNRVMEKQSTVFTPEVAGALQAGQTVNDFEKKLKASAKWRETKNGQEELNNLAANIGQLTGFF